MTDDTLAWLRELAAKASPGPWREHTNSLYGGGGPAGIAHFANYGSRVPDDAVQSKANAQLASLAHRVLPLAEALLGLIAEHHALACHAGHSWRECNYLPATLRQATPALADLDRDGEALALGAGEDAKEK